MEKYDAHDLYNMILKLLPQSQESNYCGFWTDGKKIMCVDLDDADRIAAFFDAMSLESINFEEFNTTEWDYKEDLENGTVDEYSGYATIYYGERTFA